MNCNIAQNFIFSFFSFVISEMLFKIVAAAAFVTALFLAHNAEAGQVCFYNNATTFDAAGNTVFTSDVSRPFVPPAERARVFGTEAEWELAQAASSEASPSPIEGDIFGPFGFNSKFQRFEWFFTDPNGTEVNPKCEVRLSYHLIPTSAGIPLISEENFLLLANRTRCLKRNPYRPTGFNPNRDGVQTAMNVINDLYGNFYENWGCDWCPHTDAYARQGTGAMLEHRLQPVEGSSDHDVHAWLLAHPRGGIKHRVETFIAGFVFGRPDLYEIKIINVVFHKRYMDTVEVQVYTDEFLAILTGQASGKRDVARIPTQYIPRVIDEARFLIASAAREKVLHPQYAAGIDWIVAQAAARK